jgi:hypothetical protein
LDDAVKKLHSGITNKGFLPSSAPTIIRQRISERTMAGSDEGRKRKVLS